jgi:hypothetical protein
MTPTLPSVPARHPALVVATVFASFACGPALGISVAQGVAPGSELAQFVSPLAFVLTFVAGMLLWFGVGAVTLVGGALRRLFRGRGEGSPLPPPDRVVVPPGYGAVLPLALGFGVVAGGVAGIVSQASSFWLACGAHLAAGAAYGSALRALARHGYLPFPEPS